MSSPTAKVRSDSGPLRLLLPYVQVPNAVDKAAAALRHPRAWNAALMPSGAWFAGRAKRGVDWSAEVLGAFK